MVTGCGQAFGLIGPTLAPRPGLSLAALQIGAQLLGAALGASGGLAFGFGLRIRGRFLCHGKALIAQKQPKEKVGAKARALVSCRKNQASLTFTISACTHVQAVAIAGRFSRLQPFESVENRLQTLLDGNDPSIRKRSIGLFQSPLASG